MGNDHGTQLNGYSTWCLMKKSFNCALKISRHFAAVLPYRHVYLYVYFLFVNVYQFLPTFLPFLHHVLPIVDASSKKISRATKIQHHPRSCMRQLLDFYNFATDHTVSRPDFWSRFLNDENASVDEKLCLCFKKCPMFSFVIFRFWVNDLSLQASGWNCN